MGKQFELNPESRYLGDHEQLDHAVTIDVEFANALRNTGIVRKYAYFDTYDGFSAFSARASEILLERTAMRNHPAFRGRESELTMTDAERWEKGK